MFGLFDEDEGIRIPEGEDPVAFIGNTFKEMFGIELPSEIKEALAEHYRAAKEAYEEAKEKEAIFAQAAALGYPGFLRVVIEGGVFCHPGAMKHATEAFDADLLALEDEMKQRVGEIAVKHFGPDVLTMPAATQARQAALKLISPKKPKRKRKKKG